jgi:tRNA threonylcarbamoyladenosine biosynthesis protein TsaB
MAILAIDTSMAACSAAILPPGAAGPIQRFEAMARGHAEQIFPMIEAVLAEAGCSYQALSRVAVTLGPGSFTGVRAGVAAARGLALAANLPMVGAGSLEIMARGAVRRLAVNERRGGFAMLHDARRDEVYIQRFTADGEAMTKPDVLGIAAALAALPAELTLIVGSGAPAVAAQAESKGRSLRACLADLLPEAGDLALLAVHREPSASPPAPVYLRAPDAKPQTAKHLARAPAELGP